MCLNIKVACEKFAFWTHKINAVLQKTSTRLKLSDKILKIFHKTNTHQINTVTKLVYH